MSVPRLSADLSLARMSSPFAARLGTNYCPKDEEILEIKALLAEPSLRLKRLDEEIAELQKAIDKLAAERDELGAFVEGHKALISPVRQLPLDVIQEIFIACLPTHRNCVMSASEVPILLGRICSSWRTISLSTPRLWARLHVVEPPRSSRPGSADELIDKKTAERLEVTKMWLGRSGQCPLSISLYIGHEYASDSASEPSHSGQFLQALVAYAPRWQHISLTTSASMLHVNIGHLTATDVPILESVTFDVQSRYPPLPNVTWNHCEMLRSPRISSFSISGNSFFPDKLPLHWDQLTDLTISGTVWESLITSERVLQTISGCPQLRSCKLAVSDGGITQILLQHPVVELPFLHTLELDFGNIISMVPQLLERLSLPELRTFTLHGQADLENPFSLAPFFTFWTHLESLNIDSNTFSKSTMLDSVRNLPSSLRQLSIRDIISGVQPEFFPLDDDVLAVLASGCPALETLLMNYCWTISDTALLHFISARMTEEYCTNLKLCITFCRRMTLDILPSVQSFIERGLNISLTYIPMQPPPGPYSPWNGLADGPDQLPSWM
ncbi:hypothetical protein B0H19DRAFT_214551 [Mycena capillaripes]|nr:hypothetical protein B0H19DRAFT_214551 [Mycena capillaripes]